MSTVFRQSDSVQERLGSACRCDLSEDVFRAFNAYLDLTNDHPDVVLLHDNAQAAMEAAIEIDERRGA